MTYQSDGNPRTGVCRAMTCRAPLLFAETAANGRRIPLDPTPNPAGNVRLERRPARPLDLAHTLNKVDAAKARAEGVELYMPHHATCPARKAFKRAK